MYGTSLEMLGWMNYKLESRLLGKKINIIYVDGTTLMPESEEEQNSLLMRIKEGVKKQLKTQY